MPTFEDPGKEAVWKNFGKKKKPQDFYTLLTS